VFRPRYRQAPFADPINWTGYRFEGHPRRPFARPYSRRRHPLVRALVVLAVIWVAMRLLRGRRYSSWF
jgi:hypothetical protein